MTRPSSTAGREKQFSLRPLMVAALLPLAAWSLSGGDGPFYEDVAIHSKADVDRDGGGLAPVALFDYPASDPFVDTLRYVLCQPRNYDQSFLGREYPIYSDFFLRGDVQSVTIFENKPRFHYKAWLRGEPSPLVVVTPGLGSHYNNTLATALAELFFLNGCSTIVVSNALNWEFAGSASTSLVPGYTPEDARDFHRALRVVVDDLRTKRDLKITRTILAGCSLGALHSLFVSAIDARRSDIGIDRVIAINPPVDMSRSLKKIDEMYGVWTKWPKAEVASKVDKAATGFYAIYEQSIDPSISIPLTTNEAKFLIGFSFHLTLRELIYAIHRQSRLGVVTTSMNWFSRNEFYDQIANTTFDDYVTHFILPYCRKSLDEEISVADLNERSGLRALESSLANDDRIRVFHNVDDFLLNDEDRRWLKTTLGDRIVFFNHGGHLGNLYRKDVREHLLKALWTP